jgi:hypothetical protein
MAAVNINIGIPLPPPIPFLAPPSMVVLPDTEVYVAPDCDQDIYFYNGWWWRPWGGRWYRSLNYDSGWQYFPRVPRWYSGVYPGWRDNYRSHMWGGQRWDYRPMPYGDVRSNWKSWHASGNYKRNWGTSGSYRQRATVRSNVGHQGVAAQRGARGAVTRGRTATVPNRGAMGNRSREKETEHRR